MPEESMDAKIKLDAKQYQAAVSKSLAETKSFDAAVDDMGKAVTQSATALTKAEQAAKKDAAAKAQQAAVAQRVVEAEKRLNRQYPQAAAAMTKNEAKLKALQLATAKNEKASCAGLLAWKRLIKEQ